MIAGGTGIAGLMSILNHADQLRYFEDYKVDLFFGVRKYEDFFFYDEICNLSKKYNGNIKIFFITSDEKVSSKINSYDVHNGFVHEIFENNLKNDYSDRIAFLGGPSKMIDLLIPTLLKIGINPDSVRYDKFG
jgi:Flavodoxin reductases (ferredoxin-NADPH reductases) family 1